MSDTKYYVDDQGNYIGGFSGSPPPQGSIEVSTPPDNALQKWDGTKWLPYVNNNSDVPYMISLRDAATNELVQFEVRNGDFNKMQDEV